MWCVACVGKYVLYGMGGYLWWGMCVQGEEGGMDEYVARYARVAGTGVLCALCVCVRGMCCIACECTGSRGQSWFPRWDPSYQGP